MNVKLVLIIMLVFISPMHVQCTYIDVPHIIKILSHIPLSQRTKNEDDLLLVLKNGFEFYEGWITDYLMLKDIRMISRKCQSIPSELMAYLLTHISLDAKDIAYCCIYSQLDEGYLCQDYATISETDIEAAQWFLDKNPQKSCESCANFKEFLAQQQKRGLARRTSDDKTQADRQRKILNQFLANTK